ncbi:M56 family metallopeptidase [Emticicia soli]
MLFLTYLLKASACMAVFYGLYFFVFRKFTFHTINRFYLLTSLCLSFIIPFVSFETIKVVKPEPVAILKPTPGASAPTDNAAYTLSNEAQPIVEPYPIEKTIDWEFYLVSAYVCVSLVLLVLLCSKLFKLISFSKQATKAGSLWIVQNYKQQTNASFFNLVFLNTKDLNDNEKAQIIAHECVHVRQLHSIDVLLVELCKIVVWFNPIVYFYKKSLIEIHEFEADLNTIQQFDSKNYAHLLLKLGINHKVDLSNQFSLHPLSTRIQFLFKKRTLTIKKLFYFLGLPLLALGIFAFAPRNEKVIYEVASSVKKDMQVLSLEKSSKPISQDSSHKKQEVNPKTLVTAADSSQHKLVINTFLLQKPEINLPEFQAKGVFEMTATLKSENTPEIISFHFFQDGRVTTAGVPENEIEIFQNNVQLINGKDYEFIYENGIIAKVRFKEHLVSETTGVFIIIKKLIEPKGYKPSLNPWSNRFTINPQILKTNDTLNTFTPMEVVSQPVSSYNSKYRYRVNLNSQIPQAPDTSKVSVPKKD